MEQTHIVPKEFASQAEAVIASLQEAAKAQGREADICLLTADSSKGFEPVTMSAVILYIGGASAVWLTKNWVDTYLWDFLRTHGLDRQSKRFLDWLGSKLPGGASAPAETPR